MKIIFTIFFLFLLSSASFCQNDTIIVGGDFNYPPFSFIDKNGNATGYDVDVMKAIAKITGLHIKFSLTNWDSTLNYLENGKVDAIMGIAYSADREKIYDFSFPLHTEYYGIFAKKTTAIIDINDLEQKKPGILAGDISNKLFFTPMGLFKNYAVSQSFPEAFLLLNSNQCDYVIAPYTLGMNVIKGNNLNEIEVKGPPILPSVFCFAVKERDYELLAWINQGIELLSRSGELDQIYEKWIKYRREDDKYKKFFYYALIGIAIFAGIAFILFFFGYSLKKQVKKKELEIKKNEVFYQNIFNAVEDGLIILDESQNIIEVNEKTYGLFSYKNRQLNGNNISYIIKKDNEEKLKDVFELIKMSKPFYKENFERELNGKKQFLTLKGCKIDISKKNNYLIVIHDTTKERINYLNLQKAKKNVDLANKAKSTFISTISHEIRTPLFAVIGYTELMAKTELSEKQKDYNKKISISGKLLLNLVNDILDLTKMEAEKLVLNLAPFNIHELVKEICEIESIRASEKSIKMISKIGQNVPEFMIGDKIYLLRILLNILNNALKFTEQGEVSLWVNVENLEQLTQNDKINIVFSIKDTGIGISEQSQKRLFNPFEQALDSKVRKYGGTGLGLAITKQLVELMNGSIDVESTLGKGSVFNVSIPLIIYRNTKILNVAEIDKADKSRQISILLVEDNEFNAEILFSQLTDANFIVTHAKSGFEAIDFLKKSDYQIILMDIEMPDMDGFATMQKIKQQNLTNAAVIALSAHNLSTEKEKALNAGMLDYLHKPISIKELSKAIYKYKTNKKEESKSRQSVISIEQGLDFFENDKETYQRALERFKKYFANVPYKLNELYNNDFDQLKNLTHNLKSASKTIGANDLSETAQNHDNILRKHSKSYTLIQLNTLIGELNKVLNEIDFIINNSFN